MLNEVGLAVKYESYFIVHLSDVDAPLESDPKMRSIT